MKIVEPSVSLLWITPDPEQKIEMAGRTCYKSENRITKDSSSEFCRRMVSSGHHAMVEHAVASFRIITDRGVSHEIVRHRIASYCLSGDTVIPRYSNNRKNLSLKELYNRQQDGQLCGRNKLMLLRSMNEQGKIVPNKFIKILYSGKKRVYKVVTSKGYEIKTTKQHIYFTPDGERQLSRLNIGSEVYVNGIKLVKDKEWLRKQYHERNLSLSLIAATSNCSYSTVRKYLKLFGLTKQVGAKPEDFTPWNKGLSEFDDPRVLKQAESLRKNHHNNPPGHKNSAWKGDALGTISGKRSRFSKHQKDKCAWCNSLEDLENHHKDHDPENFSESNKLTLCIKCHNLHHKGVNVRHVIADKITSIEFMGFEDTYDIEMADPYHNFVANGFVVHNSQESTRYCNYGSDKFDNEISVIEPPGMNTAQRANWREDCTRAEDAYLLMLMTGGCPQIARSVLPTCLKTELVMTANFREWRHFIKLRSSKAAHPQIRPLAKLILNELMDHAPNIFYDLYEEVTA